ncbi:MAG: 16S rRNA (uracil(1498)-N(3))-methyltransferase [Termitinemataceae bacterium]|nr:MAG: 16S rRNA (uracil(1498)-N(3))-methyltransferase [Termitinemataceae bacterium]
MKQFILETEPKNGIVSLSGSGYRYLVLVRRMKKGDALNVRLPNGESAVSIIQEISGGTLTLQLTSIPASSPAAPISKKPALILLQAMPKGSKLDLIVRQAAEVGITKVVPFFSKHCIKQDAGGWDAIGGRTDRLRRIVKEARQQSGSAVLTELSEPLGMAGLFEYWRSIAEQSLGLLVYELGSDLPSKLLTENAAVHGASPPQQIVFAIGPEGGFAAEEADLFIENGFKSISLGSNILRVETAALYAASAIQTLLNV